MNDDIAKRTCGESVEDIQSISTGKTAECVRVAKDVNFICDQRPAFEYGSMGQNAECHYDAVVLYNNMAVYCYDESGTKDKWHYYQVKECDDSDYSPKDLSTNGPYLMGNEWSNYDGIYVLSRNKNADSKYASKDYNTLRNNFLSDKGYVTYGFNIERQKRICKIDANQQTKSDSESQKNEENSTEKTDTNEETKNEEIVTQDELVNKIGAACPTDKLPKNASAGHYIKSGNKIVCAATSCVDGTYLVYKNGNSMGWCTFAKCADGQLDSEVRNGIDTVNQHGKSFCKAAPDTDERAEDEPVIEEDVQTIPDESQSPKPVPVIIDTRNNCERGIVGWVVYDGKCMTIEARNAQISARIKSSMEKIEQIRSGLDTSVWKTAEGNFNGARLASDSIAGVVLGSAGGLITSKLVKKNQLKKGFEDIQCEIGGQTVANYGDDFTVGM